MKSMDVFSLSEEEKDSIILRTKDTLNTFMMAAAVNLLLNHIQETDPSQSECKKFPREVLDLIERKLLKGIESEHANFKVPSTALGELQSAAVEKRYPQMLQIVKDTINDYRELFNGCI